MTKVKIDRTLYAITDPNWGEPKVIPQSIRSSTDAAVDAVLWMSEHSLYHGGSQVAQTKGHWSGLEAQGYRVVAITVEVCNTFKTTPTTFN